MKAAFAALLLAALMGDSALAADREPPASVTRCDSIEQLQEDYPDAHFTKLSPDETTAFMNKFHDPANEMVIFYSVPFPPDPHFTVIHGYTIKGCWAGATQIPADEFEKVIHGGEI